MAIQTELKRIRLTYFFIFFFFTIAIGLGGHFFYKYQKKILRQEKWDQINAIADLKVKQVVEWRKERLGDATIIKSLLISHHFQDFLENPKSTAVMRELTDFMSVLQKYYDYRSILFLDAGGKVRLSYPEKAEMVGPTTRKLTLEAMERKEVILSDLYWSEINGVIRLNLFIPILVRKGNNTHSIGVILLRMDPYKFLFPLIQSCPTPSKTSECILIRREGEEVVVLNELRHQKDAALKLRFKNHQEELPVVKAVMGEQGVMEGLDSRGVPVFAAARPIPGSTWHLVTQIEQEEVYALIQTRAKWVGTLVGILIIGAALWVGLLVRWQHAEFEKKEYGDEIERLTLSHRLDYLSRYANDIILLMDQDLKIIEVNERALESYGYTREEILQLSLRDLQAPETRPVLESDMEKVKGQNGLVLETLHQRKDGSVFPIEGSIRLIDVGGKSFYQAINRDITERKRTEEERANLHEQLRQSQKVEAIGQLAGGIAHDFNNLLTIIKGYGQFSLLELQGDHPLRENVEEIQKAADRASALTRQLLAFSRRQIMEVKVLDLNTVLRDLDKMLRRIIGEDIELFTLLEQDLGSVKTDPGQIEQVIMNIAVNARDAMPKGGKLVIETANMELSEEYARNHVAVTPGRYVMLSMSDTGVGMTPEVKDRIFEPFFTTKEKGKGTGLGLSTVYGIVKQSGGNIWVYSEPGQGTTFKIYLPRVDEPPEVWKEKEVKEEIPGGKETILIVEDDESVRKMAVLVLGKKGYAVLEAKDGNEALLVCKEHKGPVHLILTDVVMPGMSGRQLVDRLTQVHENIKTLYMSGYTDNAVVHHGVLEKGVNFIQKPFTLDGLGRKVREVLDKDSNRGNQESLV